VHWQAFAHSPRRPTWSIGSNWLWHFKCLFCGFWHLAKSQGLEDVVYACALCLIRALGPEKVIPVCGQREYQSFKVDGNSAGRAGRKRRLCRESRIILWKPEMKWNLWVLIVLYKIKGEILQFILNKTKYYIFYILYKMLSKKFQVYTFSSPFH